MRNRALAAKAHATLVGLGVLGTSAACAFMPSVGVAPTHVAYVLGFILLGAFVGAAAVSRRTLDLAAVLVAAWAGGFGFWFPKLHAQLEQVAPIWAEAMPWLPSDIAVMLPLAAAILAAGVGTALGLGLATDSLRLLGQTAVASLGAAVGALMLRHGDWPLMVAIVGWQTLVGVELGRWAVAEAMRGSGIGCPHCGNDIRGLATPVCPRCHKPVSRGRPDADARRTAA